MESPVVPKTRTRLMRDYTSAEDQDDISPQIRRYREGTHKQTSGGPRGYDVEGQFEASPRDKRQNGAPRTVHSAGQPREYPPTSPVRSLIERIPSHQKYQDSTSEHTPQQKHQDDLRKLNFPTKHSYEPSVTSTTRSQATEAPSTGITSSANSRLPDFFSNEVFQVVLHNPTTSHQLLKFARSRLCAENIEYLAAVDRYQALLNDVAATLFDIHKGFLSTHATTEINLPEQISTKLHRDLKSGLTTTLPKMESIFVDSQHEIENLVSNDIYPRFVRKQVTLSATRALAGPTAKNKYGGLGDCFVLTDPSKADNPIVYASDGFVKVTGYPRSEIIPRNCRFLQGRHTDRKAVKRLKVAIDGNEETVELLLNERKDGEPFWNLLLVSPLRDARGNVVFFLGGQINCSTTVHSQSDVLKILSMAEDDVGEQEEVNKGSGGAVQQQQHSQERPGLFGRLLSGYRKQTEQQKPLAVPGMEGGLLGKMERLDVRRQLDAFYTAYSKYLVINASTLLIAFHSTGLLNLFLRPSSTTTTTTTNNNNRPQTSSGGPPRISSSSIIGTSIFSFLSQHSPNNNTLPSGFKTRVKSAIKEGRALSLEVRLMTARYQGAERFVSHWTMLKGADKGAMGSGGGTGGMVEWVVVAFGGRE